MRASQFTALMLVLSLAFTACDRPPNVRVTPPKASAPVVTAVPDPVFVSLTITVEPKQATVRVGSKEFTTDENGTVVCPVEVGGAYYVSAVAPGYARSRFVRVVVKASDMLPLYFVLRKELE